MTKQVKKINIDKYLTFYKNITIDNLNKIDKFTLVNDFIETLEQIIITLEIGE